MDHKGFCIAGFCLPGDSLHTRDYLAEKGISVNWCPPEFRSGMPPRKNDFYRYYFGNSNDYVVTRASGEETSICGIWLVHWATNTWTSITERATSARADFVAVHFGETITPAAFALDTATFAIDDTVGPVIDLRDPKYQIVYPNGGEVFNVGDTLEVKVRSYRDANAMLLMMREDESFPFPGLNSAFNPRTDSVFTAVIPESIAVSFGRSVSMVSDSWLILVQDYDGTYADYSDGVFGIVR